mmetsp:Transcript_15811/g.46133  ORF Transcript_15811/g.46133 Transcript_15811/m.46133 type:complete len:150 (-) Transcript_15811:525-974(-)
MAPPATANKQDGLTLMLLMPVSQAIAWNALLNDRKPVSAIYCAAFYWLWAMKNLLKGPLKADLGVASFAGYVGARYWGASSRMLFGAAVFICVNYAMGLALVGMAPPKVVAKKLKKSEAWVQIFRAYCATALGYWILVAYWHWLDWKAQ